ncbi:hypothetical protein AUJ14_06215 [Candidatus Micrarchaeota archaeon CG1_02_55_22]|nr:MAG: hypothetical protein AUJ14_06215 [Candidatus Micrarchaeota archaeon CG1_02_55_22]
MKTTEKIVVRAAQQVNHYSLIVLTRKYFPYINFSHDELQRRLDSKKITYLVALAGNSTVGFIDYELQDGKAQILGLAVIDEYRHHGIASRLMQSALDDVAAKATQYKIKRVDLLVSEQNPAAQALYKKFGFTPSGKLGQKLWNQEVIIYSKLL